MTTYPVIKVITKNQAPTLIRPYSEKQATGKENHYSLVSDTKNIVIRRLTDQGYTIL